MTDKKKRTLTDGTVIDRMVHLLESEKHAVQVARSNAEGRVRQQYNKRRHDLMQTVPEQRHRWINAAVEAMFAERNPDYLAQEKGNDDASDV